MSYVEAFKYIRMQQSTVSKGPFGVDFRLHEFRPPRARGVEYDEVLLRLPENRTSYEDDFRFVNKPAIDLLVSCMQIISVRSVTVMHPLKDDVRIVPEHRRYRADKINSQIL